MRGNGPAFPLPEAFDPDTGKDSLRYTLINKSFATYVLASMLIQLVTTILMASIPFFTKYVLHVEGMKASLLLAAIFLVALPLLPFWTWLTRRMGGRQAMILAVILFGLSLIPFSAARNYLWGILAAGSLGIGLAGILLLLDVLISDVIDEDQKRTGRRREGMYFGIQGFFVRLGIMLQGLICGLVLNNSGYIADQAVQPASAILGFRLLIGAVPGVILVLSLVALYLYPLHGRRLRELRDSKAAAG